MESSYATSIELQNSVAVETAERELSLPSIILTWELFDYRLTELSMCWLARCKSYARLWRFRGLHPVSSRVLLRMRTASLAAWMPNSQYP
jgi:hypothetical protein